MGGGIGEGAASTNQARHDYVARGVTVGFFTDPLLCIGCKSCEVACKEWNDVPADGYHFSGHSYDNSWALSGTTWRHVLFLEEDAAKGGQVTGVMDGRREPAFRWVFLSDVCKHCGVAGCLEACPTGAIVRTEVGSVLVQDDVCNGCGYCVVWCPFGVIDRRPTSAPGAGGAFKCTFCYDRQVSGEVPACAKACPTESIRFGPLEELRREAAERVRAMHAKGITDAAIYDPQDTSVEGTNALFLVLGAPEAYGLPPRPVVPTEGLRASWTAAFVSAAAALGAVLVAFAVF